MSVQHPRHRLVNFRLSSDEYENVFVACQAEGSRTVSEFARDSVLGRARKQDAGPQTLLQLLIAVKTELEVLAKQTAELTISIRANSVSCKTTPAENPHPTTPEPELDARRIEAHA